MHTTDDIRIQGYTAMKTPQELKQELPISKEAEECVQRGRKSIQDILDKKDRRLLIISGPCSIHDEEAALEYAQRLARLSRQVNKTMVVAMRVYFEKPRTTVG